jgi:hypothetical protein
MPTMFRCSLLKPEQRNNDRISLFYGNNSKTVVIEDIYETDINIAIFTVRKSKIKPFSGRDSHLNSSQWQTRVSVVSLD